MIHLSKCDQPKYCPSSDGPWQSFLIQWNLDDVTTYSAAVFPTLGEDTLLLAGPGDGHTGPEDGDARPERPEEDAAVYASKQNTTIYFDYMANRYRLRPPSDFRVSINLTVPYPATSFKDPRIRNRQITQVGQLGLGPTAHVALGKLMYEPGIIELLQKNGSIESATWSMHLGSALHGPRNSLMFGGYDQSRAIGDVGVFDIVLGNPKAFIVDISLGIEAGASPFSPETGVTAQEKKSVWQSLGDIAGGSGAAYGAAVMNFSTTYPGIYLPLNNCDAIAKHLPLVWREDIEYYAWDTSDDRYRQIISSPAYLAFTFSDRSARNITVKVPFLHLNLTLGSPFTENPTPYFPCRPAPDNTALLGRAFLQSAFVGINYDTSLTYIAQAPGPSVGQFVSAEFPQDDTVSFQAQPSASFAESWASKWTPLAETSQAVSGNNTHGLSPGSIAGISVGIVAAFVIVGVSVWMIWKRKNKPHIKSQQSPQGTAISEVHAEPTKIHELYTKMQDKANEDPERPPTELPG